MYRVGFLLVLVCVILSAGAFFRIRRNKTSSSQNEITLDPKSLLFSLPTISDDSPATIQEGSDLIRDAISIYEDDWRQIEFVERAALPEVQHELRESEAFKNQNRVGMGWKNVYVRKQRPTGLLPSRLSFNLIDSLRHDPVKKLAMGTFNQKSIVKNGFAVRLGPSDFMYGREFNGTLANLALSRFPGDKESSLDQQLLALCEKFNLVIVDWCAGRIFPPRQ
jgi:hypothetical protein